uniref:Uncharacterized protein n=1 Tax=Rhizophora mucronata TaxID=61149 RepID=A0A2P2N0Y0_RHIMU
MLLGLDANTIDDEVLDGCSGDYWKGWIFSLFWML